MATDRLGFERKRSSFTPIGRKIYSVRSPACSPACSASEYRQTKNVNLFNGKRAWRHESVRKRWAPTAKKNTERRRMPWTSGGRVDWAREGWKVVEWGDVVVWSQTKASGNFSNSGRSNSLEFRELFFPLIFLINYRYWLVPDLTLRSLWLRDGGEDGNDRALAGITARRWSSRAN